MNLLSQIETEIQGFTLEDEKLILTNSICIFNLYTPVLLPEYFYDLLIEN